MIDLTRRSLFGVLCSLPMWLMAACHRAATITEPDWTLHPVDQQFGSTSVTMWTILYADVVVSATLSLSKEADNALDSGQSFVRLPLLVSHVYKGALKSEALELQFLPRESVRAAVKPSKLVREAAGQKSIFFLIAFEEFMPSTVYNLNRVSPSIVSWTPTSERQIVEEMASLKRFAESVRQYLDLHVPPLEAVVASLIDQLMKRETCLEAGQKLDALGKQAIPSLVRHLGDWRPLAIQSFSVRAEKGNFEGLSHYAPEVVADLLTTVLNRKVGSGLGFKETGRGSSNLHRRNMVEGWRVWLGCALQLPR